MYVDRERDRVRQISHDMASSGTRGAVGGGSKAHSHFHRQPIQFEAHRSFIHYIVTEEEQQEQNN